MLSPSSASPTRAIALLALAGFASQSMVRSADTLLPQIATDLAISVGAAAVVVSAYTLAHGSMQLFLGPFADRFSKYRMSAIMCALSAVTVAFCGLADGLAALTLARIASGLTASWIIPLGLAYIGDAVPYEGRQPVIARYLTGQISGQLFGQAAGGIIGDLLGWRAAFFIHAAIFAIAALALAREFIVNPATRTRQAAHESSTGALDGYRTVLADLWSRRIILWGFLESGLMFGAFAFVGADLHLRFGLGFTVVGAIVATFAVGGLIYAASVMALVNRLGQRGLAACGGLLLGVAYLVLALAPVWWVAPIGVTLIGLGFYMLHNTLQTNATQMSPRARGTAVGLFSCALYLGQTLGVALAAIVVDRAGAPAAFLAVAVLLPALGLWFAAHLKR